MLMSRARRPILAIGIRDRHQRLASLLTSLGQQESTESEVSSWPAGRQRTRRDAARSPGWCVRARRPDRHDRDRRTCGRRSGCRRRAWPPLSRPKPWLSRQRTAQVRKRRGCGSSSQRSARRVRRAAARELNAQADRGTCNRESALSSRPAAAASPATFEIIIIMIIFMGRGSQRFRSRRPEASRAV
jgi:hypothetical protein